MKKFLAVLILSFFFPATAYPITLAWYCAENAAYYKMYYGTQDILAGAVAENVFNMGLVHQITIPDSNFTVGVPYYFVFTACNNVNVCSEYSNQVVATRTAAPIVWTSPTSTSTTTGATTTCNFTFITTTSVVTTTIPTTTTTKLTTTSTSVSTTTTRPTTSTTTIRPTTTTTRITTSTSSVKTTVPTTTTTVENCGGCGQPPCPTTTTTATFFKSIMNFFRR